MAPPSSRGSSRSGSSSRSGGTSRGGGSSRGGGGGSTNAAATIVAVAVVGLIIGAVVLMPGKKKAPPSAPPPASVPVTPTKASEPSKPPPKPYPPMPQEKLAEGIALVKTFEADGAKADALYKESQQAKKDGDDAKWQSKLTEAKDLVSNIKDQWNDFIGGLPASKDYDQEEVARHYFEKESGQVTKLTKVLAAMKSDEK